PLVAHHRDLRRGTVRHHVQQRDDGVSREVNVTKDVPGLVQDPAERYRDQFQVRIDSLALERGQGGEEVIVSGGVGSRHENRRVVVCERKARVAKGIARLHPWDIPRRDIIAESDPLLCTVAGSPTVAAAFRGRAPPSRPQEPLPECRKRSCGAARGKRSPGRISRHPSAWLEGSRFPPAPDPGFWRTDSGCRPSSSAAVSSLGNGERWIARALRGTFAITTRRVMR